MTANPQPSAGMQTALAVAAGPIKKRRRDGKAEDGPPDAPINNFELLSAVAQHLSSGAVQHGSMQRSHPSDDMIPPASNGRQSAPTTHQLSHPRPLRPPPRFGSISDPQVSTAALQAAGDGSRWGVSAWLESHRTAALLRGQPGKAPVLGVHNRGQFSGGDMRKLVAQVIEQSSCPALSPLRCSAVLISIDYLREQLQKHIGDTRGMTIMAYSCWRTARGWTSANAAGVRHQDAASAVR